DEPHVVVTRLRFADTLGQELGSPFARLLGLPAVPEVLGFDPRLQFVHDDDAIAALVHATVNQVPGAFNVAGQGVEPWSEVCTVIGRRRVPLPPVLTAWAAEPLRVLRIANLPREVLRLLRYGRAVDTSRYQHEGFRSEPTPAGAVHAFAKAMRLRANVADHAPEYRYDRDVEAFFRHSPAVVRDQ